jgi:hypothetical protein
MRGGERLGLAFVPVAIEDSRYNPFMNSDRALALRPAETFAVPALIANVGSEAAKRFFEFFTVPIRNKNTRAAYYHAIGRFLDWCDRCGFRHLEDLEPIHIAAYIEQHPGSPATVKQHMARALKTEGVGIGSCTLV